MLRSVVRAGPWPGRLSGRVSQERPLPAGLADARELASACEFAHTDSAQAELAVERARPAAAGAAVVRPHRELRYALGLGDHRLLSHFILLVTASLIGRRLTTLS